MRTTFSHLFRQSGLFLMFVCSIVGAISIGFGISGDYGIFETLFAVYFSGFIVGVILLVAGLLMEDKF